MKKNPQWFLLIQLYLNIYIKLADFKSAEILERKNSRDTGPLKEWPEGNGGWLSPTPTGMEIESIVRLLRKF